MCSPSGLTTVKRQSPDLCSIGTHNPEYRRRRCSESFSHFHIVHVGVTARPSSNIPTIRKALINRPGHHNGIRFVSIIPLAPLINIPHINYRLDAIFLVHAIRNRHIGTMRIETRSPTPGLASRSILAAARAII